MYDNRILCAHEKAKAEDLECIEQKFQVKKSGLWKIC